MFVNKHKNGEKSKVFFNFDVGKMCFQLTLTKKKKKGDQDEIVTFMRLATWVSLSRKLSRKDEVQLAASLLAC